MKPFQGAVSVCALAVLVTMATPAPAAWNNVFQVCCNSCKGNSSSSGYAAYYEPVTQGCPQPCPPAPCPQQCCTTQMVQRSYYQPVTTYERRTYYEPVTTYRTSYYYEPVTSYRYSCYYDPCTCQYQSVATPVTSYKLKQKCDPVTSYMQRCQMVPVTKQQQMFYYEPVTTCTSNQQPAAPVQTQPPPMQQPAVQENVQPGTQPQAQQPGVEEKSNYAPQGRKPSNYVPPMPDASNSGYRQPSVPQAPQKPAPPSTIPSVKLDKIVLMPNNNFEGRVVRDDRSPEGKAQVLLVSATENGMQRTVTADDRGNFSTSVPAGKWLVYVRDPKGTPVFQAQMEVNSRETRQVVLTSR